MNKSVYLSYRNKLVDLGYQHEIEWAENVKAPVNDMEFAVEYIWIVCNSGMKNQVAEKIFDRVIEALTDKKSASTSFNHEGKTKAIDYVWKNQTELFNNFMELLSNDASNQTILDWLQKLPWIGHITKFHLAKNYGLDVAKPDRHLGRLAAHYNTTPAKLCESLSNQTSDRVATVDLVIWRACNLGLINTKKLAEI